MEAPRQVKAAIALLWAALAISMLDAFVTVMPEQREVRVAPSPLLAATFAFWAVLIYFTAKRRSWARFLLLFFTILSIGAYLLWPQDLSSQSWGSLAATMAYTVIDIAALVMLFSGVGAKWFRPQPEEVPGAF